MRAEVLHTIKTKSFIGPEDAAGNKALSRDKLEKALAAIGDGKLKVLFNPQERKFLNDMVQVTKLREPVRGTALGRGPSAQAVARLEQKLKDIPLLGSLVNFINLDVQGRAALKASPERVVQKALPSPTRQLAAQAAGVGAVTAAQE